MDYYCANTSTRPWIYEYSSTVLNLAEPWSVVGSWQGGVTRTLLSCRGIRAQIKDSEDVTSKMHGCDIDIKVALSESLICALVITYWYHT